MSTQTEHLKLDLREAADIFNPLSTNANFESLDDIIYEIQTKGGVPTYTTTASANLLKLDTNPTPNETVFKFVAAGDANTWSYRETINNIVDLSGVQKTVKAGNMYVAWVNAANAMVVIAWPDVVNAQTFDGKGPAEWASKADVQAVSATAANATQTAQAAATVANQALEAAQKAGMAIKQIFFRTPTNAMAAGNYELTEGYSNFKMLCVCCRSAINLSYTSYFLIPVPFIPTTTIDALCMTTPNGQFALARLIGRNIYFPDDTHFNVTVDYVQDGASNWVQGGGGNLVVNAIYGIS